MNAASRLGAYGLVLAACLGAGAAVGGAVDPVEVGEDAPHPDASGHGDATDGHDDETGGRATELPAGGLLVAQDGYAFEPEQRVVGQGPFAFAITGPDGDPVERYELLHDRELHLIVASRDLQQYAHLHPERDAAGRWLVELPALPPGAYRAFADFQPAGGEQLTLGVDLTVPGPVAAPAALAPSDVDAVDGFEVTLERHPGDHGEELAITVRREGQVVVTEPYLGAAGHLVALRDGDLAYLHVHPLDDEPRGLVRFAVEVPSAGTYALFFDFQVDGVVRTARFVLEVEP